MLTFFTILVLYIMSVFASMILFSIWDNHTGNFTRSISIQMAFVSLIPLFNLMLSFCMSGIVVMDKLCNIFDKMADVAANCSPNNFVVKIYTSIGRMVYRKEK